MTTTKRLPAERRRLEIIRCGARVFARSNYRVARVADIAAAVGISEAAIYKHFPSKKVIFLEVLRDMSARLLNHWKREVGGEPDALTALRNIGTTYYRRQREHPDDLKVLFQAISEVDDEDIAQRLRENHQAYVRFITSVITRGVREGSIRSDLDPTMAAWMFNSGGVLMNLMKLLSLEGTNQAQLITSLINHFIASIQKPS